MPQFIVILGMIIGLMGGFFCFLGSGLNAKKEERQVAGFLCIVLWTIALTCSIWMFVATPYKKVVVSPIYKMDNQVIVGDKITHEYYLGFVNDKGEKENVTSSFKTIDVDPTQFEAVETYHEGYSSGIEWWAPRELIIRSKANLELNK